MEVYLRASHEFQKVYRQGRRYDTELMTAFVLPNKLSYNRFGVTASRKALGNAVQRNRARRLLKETFRLKRSTFDSLLQTYDWVVNAKRNLPSKKVSLAIEEIELLISRVAKAEAKENLG